MMTALPNPIFAFIGGLGAPEIIVVMVIALLLFGKRLPEVGRSLGKGIIEFKKGVKGIEDDMDDEVDKAEQKARDRKQIQDADDTDAS